MSPFAKTVAFFIDGTSAGVQRHQVERAQPDGMLSRGQFLQQLRLERQRTDRSGAPLSVALFESACDPRDERRLLEPLLDVLRANKREVDLAACLGRGLVAVLLPDTDAGGAEAFVRRISSRIDGLPWSASTSTHPDHLFENLLHGSDDRRIPASALAPESDSYLLKRGIDIVGALVALAIFSPLMLLTAAAVRLTSPGPVIFTQTRLGKGGVPFAFYKFRSMRCNADDGVHREFVTRLIKGDPQPADRREAADPCRYKMKTDPRITPIGRIIRVTSIDELPQLFCVIKGDMSLVGPRPPLPYEAKVYQRWHCGRLLGVKPGITGLWQINGRSKVSFDDMVRMDLRYIRDCSLALDVGILFKTVGVVLRREGAS